VGAVAFLAMPFVSSWLVLVVVHVVANSSIFAVSTGLIGCLNNCLPSDQRAAVNGVVVAFESFAKGLGPMLGSTVFAWTLQHWGRAGHGVAFFAIAILNIAISIGTHRLPQSAETKSPSSRQTLETSASEAKAVKPVLLGATKPRPLATSDDDDAALSVVSVKVIELQQTSAALEDGNLRENQDQELLCKGSFDFQSR